MDDLGQVVFRHIIATSGIPQMINDYIKDLNNSFFSSRTTIHYSLHGTVDRDEIMPINKKFPYKESLTALSDILVITGEKPCIGILLLNNFFSPSASQPYTMDFNGVQQILAELNPELVRLSFCEFNGSADLGTFDIYDSEQSEKILSYAQSKGFESKLFSSFGKEEVTACGMLGGKVPKLTPSAKWAELESESEKLVSLAMSKYK